MIPISIAERLTPHAVADPRFWLERYPPRCLPDGAKVTRIAPSPTGFMHLGGLYAALISERLARSTGGVFYLRIEDTDSKRALDGAAALIVSSLSAFGLAVDEGETAPDVERGTYGPYRQSLRRDIYQTFVRRLLARGLAYPCFATPDELAELRGVQERSKVPPGYYGEWAIWRGRPKAAVQEELLAGRPCVVRLRAPTEPGVVTVHDEVRGPLRLPGNANDIVLLKADGTPTYHLAHVVDDHLMGTTDVVRGAEWLPSLPLHLQLFEAFGWRPPRYAHIAPIEKVAAGARRKLSKRHDPEASVEFYLRDGYPVEAVIEYLMRLADSGFEGWRSTNPAASWRDYGLAPAHMSRSGALFDLQKLQSVARSLISRMSVSEVFDAAAAWAGRYAPEFHRLMTHDRRYTEAALMAERSGGASNSGVSKWSDLRDRIGFFFDEIHSGAEAARCSDPTLREALARIARRLGGGAPEAVFDIVRETAGELGYAATGAELRKAPDRYPGQTADVAMALRMALTGASRSPDLAQVVKVLGVERVQARVARAIEADPGPREASPLRQPLDASVKTASWASKARL